MFIKITIGILLSVVFLYLAFTGVDPTAVLAAFPSGNYTFLVLSGLSTLVMLFVRAFRWHLIVASIRPVPMKVSIPSLFVGYTAIILLPIRLGEVIKPYIVSRKSELTFSEAIASVLVERFFDTLMLLLIFAVVFLFSDIPGWLISSGYVLAALFGVVLILFFSIVFGYSWGGAIIKRVFFFLPEQYLDQIVKMMNQFEDAIRLISSPMTLVTGFFLSILVFFLSGFTVYSLFVYYNYSIPGVGAVTVLLITMAGIYLPSAPGFMGNFQLACVVALGLFGISREDALAYSISYYFTGVILAIVVGFLFFPFIHLSIRETFEVVKGNRKDTKSV